VSPRPPLRAERFLLRALGGTDAARAVVGDLNEDHAREAEARGARRAALWYWREAVAIAAGSYLQRITGRLGADVHGGEGRIMSDIVSRVGFLQDARFALRAIRRDRGFFVFSTLIIGLGVGASTAVFSVMSPLLLRPLPFEEPERLAWVANGTGGGLSGVTSRTSNLRDFRALSQSFEGLTGYNAFFDQASYNLVGVGEPERLVGAGVADDFLDVLGVQPAVGRDFVEEEGVWDGRPAILLSHGFWERRFGADPAIVGSTLTIDDVPREVVGILPATFDFSSVFTPSVPVDFLLPWPISDETDAWGNTTSIIGRLRPGVTVEAAQAELDNILAGLREADPGRWGLRATVSGLQEQIARPFRSALLLLAAAAGVVMLIVCANLSNMLLARSPRRRREMALRRTMGATRGRLVRHLLLESVIVSMCGAVVGLGIAVAATRFVTGTSGLDLPMLAAISVDASALGFTVLIALLAGLVVGVLPALQVSEGGEAEALVGSSRGSSAGPASRRLRDLLVVGEVAMACVLLVFGGLVLKSFQRVMDIDLGYQPENAVAWQLSTSRDFDSDAARVAFFEALVESVSAVPGVEGVALTDALPLGRNRTWGTLPVVGVERDEDDDLPSYFPHLVDHRYLETMRIPLVRGRGFTADDTDESAPVALVNEAAARVYFPDGEALGHFLDMWYGATEVVGVVEDVRHRGVDIGGDPEVYFPLGQSGDFQSLDMVVRTSLPAASISGPVGEAVRRIDPQIPVEDFWTLDSVVERSVSPRRFTLQLLGAFAGCALLLAGLGIYGVLSYSVTERLPEIGIRMALGESAAEVRRSVVRRTLALAGTGVAVGALVALTGTRMIDSLLYGVEPTDPATFITMIAALMTVALLSGLIPAIRASRTDSAHALRSAA
jgi:putative ABC transport system permease protein